MNLPTSRLHENYIEKGIEYILSVGPGEYKTYWLSCQNWYLPKYDKIYYICVIISEN